MAMHLQELHPSAVHYPIALLPLSIAADTLGLLTRNRSLLELGRLTMPVAAASAAVAGVLGLIAQEVVETDDEGMEMLITHRTLNLGLLGVAAAAWDLGLGFAGVAASPLPGPSGNVEFFVWLRRGAPAADEQRVRAVVATGVATPPVEEDE